MSYGALVAALAGVAAAAKAPPQQPPQQPTGTAVAQPPAAAPAAVPASRKFTADNGIIFSVIKPDKTADFEMVMGRVKEALAKSTDAKRKQQALSWRVFKGIEAGPGGNIVYIWFLDPAVKDVEYTVTDILREGFPHTAAEHRVGALAQFGISVEKAQGGICGRHTRRRIA